MNLSTKAWREANPDKMRRYRRSWYRKNKKRQIARQAERRAELSALIDALKVGKACPCGESHPAALDFHHRDPEQKLFAISAARGTAGKQRLLEEIAKCDVICSNCHRKHHYTPRVLVHGSVSKAEAAAFDS